jgi:four helix bundle protein
MNIEELKVYSMSMELGDAVWNIVGKWDYFAKDTIGKQITKSADSIAANISEGFGRYHYKESVNFGYFARGSLYETKTWVTKSYNRKLIDEGSFLKLSDMIIIITRMLNAYIKSIGGSDNKLKEPDFNYETNSSIDLNEL